MSFHIQLTSAENQEQSSSSLPESPFCVDSEETSESLVEDGDPPSFSEPCAENPSSSRRSSASARVDADALPPKSSSLARVDADDPPPEGSFLVAKHKSH